jgi:hypothetical protein
MDGPGLVGFPEVWTMMLFNNIPIGAWNNTAHYDLVNNLNLACGSSGGTDNLINTAYFDIDSFTPNFTCTECSMLLSLNVWSTLWRARTLGT